MTARDAFRAFRALRSHVAVLVLALALALALSVSTWSALGAQELIVTADASRLSVGEQITVRAEARLGGRALLVERTLRPADSLPDGVRVVSEDSLTLAAGRAFVARMRVAFFRPGVTSVPALALVYRTSEDAPPDTLRSRPVPIEVVTSLPPGNQSMRDIKDLETLSPRPRDTRWLGVLAASALLVLLYLAGVRRARRRGRSGTTTPRPLPVAVSPFDSALAQLAEIEATRWPARGQVARHYERVADVLRRYLEDGHGVRATDRTTSELVWSLPPTLSNDGRRGECRALLEEADLVKFARLRPDEAAAAAFLARAHALLDHWRAAPEQAPDSASLVTESR